MDLAKKAWAAMNRDRRRGRTSALTPVDLRRLLLRSGGRCEVTGLEFVFDQQGGWARHPFGPSIDRIDPDLPYSFENCRMVCTAANVAINEWGEAVFAQVAEAYLRRGAIQVAATPPQAAPARAMFVAQRYLDTDLLKRIPVL